MLARGLLAAFRCDETAALAAVTVPTLPRGELLALSGARHQALHQRHEALDEAVLAFADGCLETPAAARAA